MTAPGNRERPPLESGPIERDPRVPRVGPGGSQDWAGTVPCWVHNKTGETITDVSCWHDLGNTHNHGSAEKMPDGTAFLFWISAYGGHNDLWTVHAFVPSLGHYMGRDQKQCNVEKSDLDSGRQVEIRLYPLKTGFDIVLPVSSSCFKNHYNGQGILPDRPRDPAL